MNLLQEQLIFFFGMSVLYFFVLHLGCKESTSSVIVQHAFHARVHVQKLGPFQGLCSLPGLTLAYIQLKWSH